MRHWLTSFKKKIRTSRFLRMYGLIRKEFIVIFRDRGTIAMLIVLPIMLLIIFGYAIDFDPKNLPTAIISYDYSPLTRLFVSGLQTSRYFKIVDTSSDEQQVEHKLNSGQISFSITIPPNFTRKFIHGENPQLLVSIDGSDPGSSATALSNITPILNLAVKQFSTQGLGTNPHPNFNRSINLTTHRLYNETNISAYNIIPGLIGTLLTFTMVMLTSNAIISELESGTMEMLLITPLRPVEIILGKIIPYITLGYMQLTTVLFFGKLLINIPFEGSLILLYIASGPFIIANLMIGMIFSTIAKTPMQSTQLSIFFQLPSVFLSGYVFSFFGMPTWAQAIGYCIPMTYFMRIARGILLKGNGVLEILPNIIPLIIITAILIFLTKLIFRKTLD